MIGFAIALFVWAAFMTWAHVQVLKTLDAHNKGLNALIDANKATMEHPQLVAQFVGRSWAYDTHSKQKAKVQKSRKLLKTKKI
jgi:hypothetical protein